MVVRISQSIRQADYGALLLEMFVLVFGILLALAVDRWNQARLDQIETAQIVERLKSDTIHNVSTFEQRLPNMERNLANTKTLLRALEAGVMIDEDSEKIESAIAYIDVIPSYPMIFAGYDELVATGRLRQLDDPLLVDLLVNQRARYEAAQAVVGYWRDDMQDTTHALSQKVDYYYTTEDMNEDGMGVRFDFAALVADRYLRNKVFDAVDIHGDWLGVNSDLYQITKQIDARLSEL